MALSIKPEALLNKPPPVVTAVTPFNLLGGVNIRENIKDLRNFPIGFHFEELPKKNFT